MPSAMGEGFFTPQHTFTSRTREALAPDGYHRFKQDAFYVVGQSDPKNDWPYAQPGPVDAWAGGRQHTFTILFALKSAPAAGP